MKPLNLAMSKNQNTPARSPRKAQSEAKNLKQMKGQQAPPGITPQLNSTKFAAIEMMQNAAMRPTSSRVGNFLSSDKPQSGVDQNYEQIYGLHQHQLQPSSHQKAYLPSNLPQIENHNQRSTDAASEEILRE